MNMSKYNFTKDSGQDPLRCTGMGIEHINKLRNSYSMGTLRLNSMLNHNEFRLSVLNKKKNMNLVKQTLDSLEQKVTQAQLEMALFNSKVTSLLIGSHQQQRQVPRKQKLPTDSSITLKNSNKQPTPPITSLPQPHDYKPYFANLQFPGRHSNYYVSEVIRAVNQTNQIALEHINASIRILKLCEQNVPTDNQNSLSARKVDLPRSKYYRHKKTLVLDLDETLIHCVDSREADVDVRTEFVYEGEKNYIGINIRRHALSFLRKMSQIFEIIVFTASHHSYADAILDMLDPDNQIFQHRLYRHHCLLTQHQFHVKDLRILNRKMSELVLIDNAPYSYAFQLENGIPILPYFRGSDYELLTLQKYLEEINKCTDVRELNKKTFKLHHYTKFESAEQLIEELYINNTL